jgi:uncharacterized protein (TIGR01655 family)
MKKEVMSFEKIMNFKVWFYLTKLSLFFKSIQWQLLDKTGILVFRGEHMKSLLKIFIPLLLICGVSWYFYQEYFGGEDYYTQITTSGQKGTSQSSSGEVMTLYTYHQKAYNKKGAEKVEKLSEYREKPLKMNAYLKLKVNKRKGVLSWVEVTEKEIPAAALKKIQQNE